MRSAGSGTLRADGRWMIRVTLTRPDGTKVRKPLYAETQSAVQNAARKLLYGEGRTANIPHTITDLIEAYKAERWPKGEGKEPGKLSKGAIRQHGPAYKRIEPYFTEELRKIDPPRVTRWLKALASDPAIGGRSVQAYRNVLSALLEFAVELGWVEENHAKGRKLPPGVSAKPQVRPRITEGDFKLILKTESDPTLRDLWELLGTAGLRPDEALILRRENIFRSMDLWWVRGGGKTPAGTDREIPLSDRLADRLLEREEWLFPFANKQGHMLYNYIRDKWEETVRKADIPYTNPYQLRKLCLTRWMLNLPEDAVTAMGGHTDIETARRIYRRLGRDRIAACVEGDSGVSVSRLLSDPQG